MTEYYALSPILNDVHMLTHSVEDFLTELNERIQIFKDEKEKLDIMTEINVSGLKNKILDQKFLISNLKTQIYMGEQKEGGHFLKRVNELDKEIKKIPNQIKEIEKELSGTKDSIEGKLNEVEKIHSDVSSKSREVDEWESTFRNKSRYFGFGARMGVLSTEEATNLSSEWSEFKTTTKKFIYDSFLSTKKINQQVKSDHSTLNQKITFLEKKLEQIISDKNGLKQTLKEVDLFKSQKAKDSQEENQELKKSLQKMKEEFELQFQQLSNKITKEKESEKLHLVTVAKRDELLREKDKEIEDLRHELEKSRELKNTLEQTEAKLVKLEELQALNATVMEENNIEIRELRGLTTDYDRTLNKCQDDDLQVKEEDSLNGEEKFMKKPSNCVETITEKIQQKVQPSLREVSESRSVNGKRNLESLLENQDNLETKSTLKVFSARKNLKNGKENMEVFSEENDQNLEGLDQVVKKNKQE